MAKSQHPTSSIELGPGGQITDCELLEELEHTPVLQPRELLKLAIYFGEFSTNVHLGDVLWTFALETIVTNSVIARDIKKIFAINIVKFMQANEKFGNPFEDTGEDLDHIFDGNSGEDDDDSREVIGQNFLLLRVSNINLLVEKRLLENNEAAFFVVGVSPNPNELPDPNDPDDRKAPASAPSKK